MTAGTATPTQLHSPTAELAMMRAAMQEMGTALASMDRRIAQLIDAVIAGQTRTDSLHTAISDLRIDFRAFTKALGGGT